MSPLQFAPTDGTMVGAEQLWLGLGAAIMLLGTLYFWTRGWGAEDPEARLFHAITTLLPAVAFASYLSMFTGVGVVGVWALGEIRPVYVARYADWLFTTPLLLLALALLADADRSTLVGLVGADGFMIVTGLVGAATPVLALRFLWWAIGTAALLYVLYTLYFGLGERAEARDDPGRSTFVVLRNLTLVLWALYPVWWALGTQGAGLVGVFIETAGFMVLDVTAKVGFGVVLLRGRDALGTGTRPGAGGPGPRTASL
ncbi:MAG: bacteriorhodopsin [Halobacteriales archaeon]